MGVPTGTAWYPKLKLFEGLGCGVLSRAQAHVVLGVEFGV